MDVGVTQAFRQLYLSRFSQPRCERDLYRLVKKLHPTRLLELGMGDGRRADRLLEMAFLTGDDQPIEYIGIDLFEAKEVSRPRLALKQAHQMLARQNARIRLIPGDPFSALARSANALPAIDLLIISDEHAPQDLARAWYFIPRLLHATSCVLWQSSESSANLGSYRTVSHSELQQLARRAQSSRQAA